MSIDSHLKVKSMQRSGTPAPKTNNYRVNSVLTRNGCVSCYILLFRKIGLPKLDEFQTEFQGFQTIPSEIKTRNEKTNILISDLVRHKPGSTATEDG